MKRFLAALVVGILVISVICVPALAASYVSVETPLGSSNARISNIGLATDAINGYSLPYGSSFSFNDVIGARTTQKGFQSAINGRGVKVVGGGVAQVASTLYLALQQVDGISFDELKTYGDRYNQDYVANSSDAVLVDAESGIDFVFTNNSQDMTIEMYISGDELFCALNFSNFTSAADASTQIARASIYVEGSSALYNNIELAAKAIDSKQLTNGELFSFNDLVGARTKERDYVSAINGRGSKVVGGGVAQVASVIWLAVEDMDDISVVEKSTYGSRYNQDYVDNASDAILTDYKAGTDFSFRYTGSGTITIRTYLNGDTLECVIASSGGGSASSGWDIGDSSSNDGSSGNSDSWW